ncbi:MAG: hypothetical protein A2V76_09035 [Candidatus Aminicenantes bacterium RBG_16_63_14]|nr:MAG: hypothetical protein A2V76_09035 [Candidatus Aminicenantes bacterium RBG_16_63_14]OGD28201.1 MAG: hypothetical protein A2V57_10265 [Candidatus Aminicenantes bacterium RBG_19FT_COMBO_65_30]
MKKAGFALALFILTAVLGSAQTSEQDQAKMMEAYMKAGAVTADHEALKFFTGRWKVEAKMWAAPGAPPTESVNTNEGEMILGGRYVRLAYKGEMMGQPFEGLQITGYDNIEKAYKTLWIDNSSTSFYLLTGKYDAAKKTYTFTGRWTDPMGGITPVRMVIKIVSPDEYMSETYMAMPDGKDFLNMSDRSVRVK